MTAASPDASWLGPAGIGPVLRAAGAASVTGPLWPIAKLASLTFYVYWFEARRTLPPLHALSSAQAALRTAEAEDVRARLHVVAPELDPDISQHMSKAMALGWRTPFEHPAFWAAFTVLGGGEEHPRC